MLTKKHLFRPEGVEGSKRQIVRGLHPVVVVILSKHLRHTDNGSRYGYFHPEQVILGNSKVGVEVTRSSDGGTARQGAVNRPAAPLQQCFRFIRALVVGRNKWVTAWPLQAHILPSTVGKNRIGPCLERKMHFFEEFTAP